MNKKDLSARKKNNLKFSIENFWLYINFKDYLEKKIQKRPFVTAVSGGPDSLALAILAHTYSKSKKSKVYFVHIDHNIRKKSKEESIQLKKSLKKKKIKLVIIKNKIKITKNIQKTARDIRYNLLSNFCKLHKIKYLLTGHHSDDQIETFLIRLSRGSGVQGLSSMSQETKLGNNLILLRPFLNVEKKYLQNIAKKVFKKYLKDPSNTNEKYLRTKIRRLKSSFELSGISRNQILRSIKNLGSTKNTLNLFLTKFLKENVRKVKKKTYMNLDVFLRQPEELRLKIIGNILKNISKLYYEPRSAKVLNLIKKLKSKNKFKSTLGGCIIEKSGNLLCFYKEKAKISV